jgi:hypothetical protein
MKRQSWLAQNRRPAWRCLIGAGWVDPAPNQDTTVNF